MDAVKGKKSPMDVVRVKSPVDVVQSLQIVMAQTKQSGEKKHFCKVGYTTWACKHNLLLLLYLSLGDKGCVSQQQFYHDK